MRDTNFQEFIKEGIDFNFGNEAHRACLVSTAYESSRNFTFGHYKIGDSGGIITVGGAVCGGRLYYSVSICSPMDNYSKKVGRQRVQDNFILDHNSSKRGTMGLEGLKDDNPAVVLRQAAEHYLNRLNRLGCPAWARNKKVLFRN